MSLILFLSSPVNLQAADDKLSWPINCVPGVSCDGVKNRIGFPDIESAGVSFSCGSPGYTGHLGTDILVSSTDQGFIAIAAADGVVKWSENSQYDHCPDSRKWECDEQNKSYIKTESGQSASIGFNAGNFVIIEHILGAKRYLTLYAHLKKDSVKVTQGQRVTRGYPLAEVGSSGNTLTPHLHFGVFGVEKGAYRPVDPWQGACNKTSNGLWSSNPPYISTITAEQNEEQRVIKAQGVRERVTN